MNFINRQFILDQWFSAFTKLYSSGILDVDLVPYGNAREYQYGGQWIFYCQHGANECLGNLIETCAIHAAGNASVYAPFIHCMEYYGPTTSNLQYCATTSHMDYATINSCVQGSLGNQLQHQMALKTDALNPPHQYVPWITVNGVHTDQIQNAVQTNMLGYVCSMYQGTKPAVCSSKTVKRAKNSFNLFLTEAFPLSATDTKLTRCRFSYTSRSKLRVTGRPCLQHLHFLRNQTRTSAIAEPLDYRRSKCNAYYRFESVAVRIYGGYTGWLVDQIYYEVQDEGTESLGVTDVQPRDRIHTQATTPKDNC
eukprot:gene4765-21069_t